MASGVPRDGHWFDASFESLLVLIGGYAQSLPAQHGMQQWNWAHVAQLPSASLFASASAQSPSRTSSILLHLILAIE